MLICSDKSSSICVSDTNKNLIPHCMHENDICIDCSNGTYVENNVIFSFFVRIVISIKILI